MILSHRLLDGPADRGPQVSLEEWLWKLEDPGFSQWRLTRELDRYVISVRPRMGRGLRWMRAAGRTATEAVERLIRRHDITTAPYLERSPMPPPAPDWAQDLATP